LTQNRIETKNLIEIKLEKVQKNGNGKAKDAKIMPQKEEEV
jgi:hypothetical protein